MGRTKGTFELFLVVAVLAFLTAVLLRAADARNGMADWDNLKKLAPGNAIQIVLNDAKSYRGQFRAVSDEAIMARVATGEQTFERRNVLRVSAKGQSHRGRNALIGAAIGAGLGGVAVGMDCHYGRKGCGAAGVVTGVPFAAGLGAGFSAMIPTGGWHDVYRAR
jgi:hypothetical protein